MLVILGAPGLGFETGETTNLNQVLLSHPFAVFRRKGGSHKFSDVILSEVAAATESKELQLLFVRSPSLQLN